jgi:hypothetical protein
MLCTCARIEVLTMRLLFNLPLLMLSASALAIEVDGRDYAKCVNALVQSQINACGQSDVRVNWVGSHNFGILGGYDFTAYRGSEGFHGFIRVGFKKITLLGEGGRQLGPGLRCWVAGPPGIVKLGPFLRISDSSFDFLDINDDPVSCR